MIDIPVEIWLQIAQYLPGTTLRNLYSLNRVFFHLAMNERYRVVLLCPRELYRNYVRLQDPSVALRVHELHLHPSSLLAELKRNVRPLNQLWTKTGSHALKSWTTNGVVKKLGRTLNLLSGLKALNLNYDHFNESDMHSAGHSLPLVRKTWAIVGSNLRALVISGPLELLDNVLLTPSPMFHELETLSITLYYPSHRTNRTTMCAALALFVNNHHATIQSLELLDSEYLTFSRTPTVSLLLPCLVHFSQLAKFRVRDYSHSSGASLRHILQLHPQLVGLDILDYNQAYLYDQLEPPGLMLRSLYLGIYRPLRPVATATILFRQLVHSLTTLVLDNYRFDFREVRKIIEVFAQEDKLRSFSLKVFTLTPECLDYFALKLPNLHKLHLSVLGFTGDVPQTGNIPFPLYKEQTFCAQMMKRDYVAWNLYYLDIEAFLHILWAGPRTNSRFPSMDGREKYQASLRRSFRRTKCIVQLSVTSDESP